MGKPSPSSEPPPNPTTSITHFSHPHPLQLLNPQTLVQILQCSACKLDATAASAAAIYACVNCNFVLHPKCSQLPQQITHPFDQKHTLTLYPKPVYPEGLFSCDACGHRGAGFSYHCSPCGIDLHTTCASLPLKLTHHLHRDPLALTFSAPYPGNSFSCDICKKLGSKTWIYRCVACEFDVHLTCVAAVAPPAPVQPQFHVAGRSIFSPLSSNRPPNVGASYGGYGPPPAAVMPPQAYGNSNQPVYGGGRPVNGLRDQMVVAAAEGIASGVAQSTTQALIQGFFGGGSGGGGGGGVDVMAVDGGAATVDVGSYYDGGGYGAADGGYGGGDGSIILG